MWNIPIKNFLEQNPDSYAYQRLKTGPAIGVFTRFKLGKRIYLYPEVLYCSKGNIMYYGSNDKNGVNYKDVTTYSYIEIPLLLKYVFPIKKISVQCDVGIAPAFKVWLDATHTVWQYGMDTITNKLSSEGRIYRNDITNDMDFCILFGAGSAYPFGKGFFILDVRCSIGVISIFKPDMMIATGIENNDIDDMKHKNRSILLTLGYMLEI